MNEFRSDDDFIYTKYRIGWIDDPKAPNRACQIFCVIKDSAPGTQVLEIKRLTEHPG